MKIVLSDDLLRAILLDWISRTAAFTEDAGGEPRDAVVEALALLSLAEVRTLAMRARGAVSVNIDRGELAAALDDIANAKSRTSQLDFFVQNGATREMLVEVLGVSQNRLDAVRRKLGRPAVGRGRPKLPDLLTRERIVKRWYQLQLQSPAERFRTLREEFPEWNLASLAAVINELHTDEPGAERKTRQTALSFGGEAMAGGGA